MEDYKELLEALKSGVNTLSSWGIVPKAATTVQKKSKEMVQAVYDIDAAMTELYKVTDETDKKYNEFLSSASKNAYELGRSVSSLIEQSTNWAKKGYSLEQSAGLAKASSVYANVAGISDDSAVANLEAAMKAFDIKAENVMSIVDSMYALGTEFGTSAESLGEGLKSAASAMADAGNDFNQTLAILAGGGAYTQDVEQLSEALGEASKRLQSMGDEIREISQGKINLFNSDGTLKSTYEQLKEIAKVYSDLSDSAKANLTELIFGESGASGGAAILQAFQSGEIQKAYAEALSSAGAASAEQEQLMESLEAKTNQFNAAFQSLSNTVLSSDLVKWFVELGTGAVSATEGIVNFLTPLGTLAAGIGAFAGYKNVGSLKMFRLNHC